MTFEQRAERLKKHPDAVEFDVAGETYHWFIGKVTFDLAEEKGLNLTEVLEAFDGVGEEEGVEQLRPMLGHFGRLLYFGTLPFYEGLDPADITDFLSVGDLVRLSPALMEKLGEHAEAERGKAEAEADRRGQSKRDRSKRSS